MPSYLDYHGLETLKFTEEGTEATIFTDNVEVSAYEVYENGVNSVTVDSVTVEGTPKASDTSITVKGTASNGESKTLIIDITAQRNDAKKDGAADVTIDSLSVYGSPRADATSITIQANASNGATKTGAFSITAQRNDAYSKGAASVNTTMYYNAGWNACRNKMIESQYPFTYQQGTTHVINLLNIGSRVIDLCEDKTITRYTVPDAK